MVDDRRLTRWVVLTSAIVLVTVSTAAALSAYRTQAQAPPEPVALTSSARHRFSTLGQLVAASDLIVVGRIVAEESGRLFGGVAGSADELGSAVGDATAIRSHVLTLEVDEVLAGSTPAGSTPIVLVEEEATLADGTPVVVDGMRAGRVGDRGVWFLVAGPDPDFPGYALVNAQGRYLMAGGALRGGDRADALVREVATLGLDDVRRAIRAEG